MNGRSSPVAQRRVAAPHATLRVLLVLAIILSNVWQVFAVAQPVYATGGSYSLDWTAADPAVNKAPYLPTYTKVPPSSLACPTPSGSVGRAADPLANAVFGNPKDSVESLAPPSMALGQIVPFEVKISVKGSTAPENGVITFTPYWLTKTSSGQDFGYDPAYEVYCAFVDTADAAAVDPGSNAKVGSWTDTVVNNGTSNEQIQGTFTVSGLDDGDTVIVEIWVVLKSTIPAGATGNVQTGLLDAKTASGDTINTGNQTVPLLRVQEFFSSDADISVTKSDSPDPVTQGQQLTYAINVKNNSTTVVANGVVATDTLDPNTTFVSASGAACSASGQTVTCNVGALSPLQSTTIYLIVNVAATAPTASTVQTGACTVGQTDLCNKVVISAITSDPNITNNSASEPTNVLPALVPNPQLNLTKSASLGTYSQVGQQINYTYVLKNVGNVALSSPYAVTDDKVSVTCPQTPNPLPVGASITCSASHAVTQADLDAGSITNTATGTAGYGGSTVTSNQVQVTVTAGQNPALKLAKSASPSTYDAAGQTISYSYLLENSGNVTLSEPVTISDDKLGTVACPATASLAPGGTITCSASHLVTQADLDAGSITNHASATASFGGNTVTSNPAEATVNAESAPALSLTKSASPTTYNTVGQAISYSYEVKNSGNVTLAGPFTVSDDKATVTCPATTSLAPNVSITCSATYNVTQADLDSGSVTNTATATNGSVTSNEAKATITAQKSPALSLSKTASPANYDAVDQIISYSYEVKNSGNVTLAGPFTVSDDKATVTCPIDASLAPGLSLTCSATYKVTQADLDASKVTNTATATNGTVTSNQATATVYAIAHPNLALVKSASPGSYSQVGDSISYAYVLTNIGNVALSSPYAVTDDKTSVICPQTPNPLPVGASITCNATYVVTQVDLDAGSVTNHASATATYGGNSVASNPASATVTAVQTRALTIDKVAEEKSYVKAGDLLHYSYLVTNAGNVTLHDAITVTDDKAAVSCPALPAAGLAPNASVTCTATYIVTQADLDAGSVTNIAYATSGTTTSPTDTVTVPATQSPAFTLAKNADPVTYGTVGQIINYSYIIVNTGNVTLSGPFTVSDNKATVTCPDDASLAPNASLNCSASYIVTQVDLDSGSVTNTAKAYAYFKGSQGASNEATATVTAEQKPALKLTKAASPTTYDAAGQTVSYSYLLENSGNVTLAGPFTVSDNKATVTCPATANLAPNASLTCTASYIVTQADVDGGSVTNIATAAASFGGKPVTSNQDQVTVNAIQQGGLGLTKSASPVTYATLGTIVSYSYEVKNTGNVTLAGPFTVNDDKLGAIACPAGNLAPNATVTCSASHPVTQADLDAGSITNNATATDGTLTSNESQATVAAVQTRALTIDKVAEEKSYVKAGDLLHYSYLVTNAGNVTLHDAITVTDDKAAVSCPALPAAGLAPNASVTCTATYVVTQADLDAGSVTNIAYATSGTTTSPTDTVTVPATQSPAFTLAKNADPVTYGTVGQIINYSYIIVNTGNVTLSGPFTVSDNKATVTCPDDASLAPNASLNCSASYIVTQVDLDSGSVTNTAKAYAYFKGSQGASNEATATVTAEQKPALKLTKAASPTTYDAAGQTVSYSYLLENSGNVTLAGPFTVSDNKATVTCPATANLAPNASLTCTASYIVTQADVDGGSVTNIATAAASFGGKPVTSNQDQVTVNAIPKPDLSLVKSADLLTYNSVNQAISYIYVLKNIGNVTLAGPFTVDDDKAAVTCPATASLAVGSSITCTATYHVTQADLDAGKVTNLATGHAQTLGGMPVNSNNASATVTAVQTRALTIDKVAEEKSYVKAGDLLHYSYLVTNAGNVTLHDAITVTDDKAAVSCPALPAAGLAPNASVTCTATYIVTQADLDAGSVANIASATDGTTTSPTDTVTVPATQSPAIDVEKTASAIDMAVVGPTNRADAGDRITYSFVIKNTGNVTLNTVELDDALLGFTGASCSDADGMLAPNATTTCSAVYAITQGNIDAGSVANTATAYGNPPQGNQDERGDDVSDTDGTTTTIPQAPILSVEKTSTTAKVTAAGQVVPYSYVVKNIGNVTLTGTTLYDNNVDADPVCTLGMPVSLTRAPLDGVAVTRHVYLPAITSGDSGVVGASADARVAVVSAAYSTQAGLTLAPGQSASCTAQHTVTQAEMDAGAVNNTATADSDQSGPAKDDLSIPVDQKPAMTFEKSLKSNADQDGSGTVNKGDTLTYRFLATNTGNVTLQNVKISDPLPGLSALTCTPSQPATLPPGAQLDCTATLVVTQAHVDAGKIANTATVKSDSTPVQTSSVNVPVPQNPVLTLTKTANPTIYSYPGQVIVYTYVVKNTGNVTLSGPFNISDDKLGSFQCSAVVSLAPDASTSCTKSYTIQASDLNATNNASITNKATAGGKDPNGKPATSNLAQATVGQVASTGQLAPTNTTCQMFANGTSGNLTTLQYGVKSNAINNVAPGVMFYYSKITAPAASFQLQVVQSNDKSWRPMAIQDLGQVIVWNANCVKSNATATYNSKDGAVSIQVKGATTGAVYYVSIKYNPGSLVGQKLTKPYPTAAYTFVTSLNGVQIIPSWDSVNVTAK